MNKVYCVYGVHGSGTLAIDSRALLMNWTDAETNRTVVVEICIVFKVIAASLNQLDSTDTENEVKNSLK